jgi:hypothetical protein
MVEELGKIERPSVETFQGVRKIYVVPLIFAGAEAPEEFRQKCELYWEQVNEQLTKQEQKVGKVNRMFHESIGVGGEDGLKVMEKWNQMSYQIVKERVANGAVLEATELMELADECMDWERCLLLGFFSRKVADTVTEHYRASAKERFEYISQRINESLQVGEVGILFIREGHSVQFPPDMDVFGVAPPALDDIHRWLRDRSRGSESEETESSDQSPA